MAKMDVAVRSAILIIVRVVMLVVCLKAMTSGFMVMSMSLKDFGGIGASFAPPPEGETRSAFRDFIGI